MNERNPARLSPGSDVGSPLALIISGVIKMQTDAQSVDTSRLSYLDASKVTSPAGVLAGLDVLSTEGKRLGSIQGVVIDAAARRVRYLAVKLSGLLGRRYLVEADQVGQIEDDRKALRLLVDIRDKAVNGLDTRALREFSDEDLLTAMFVSQPA